MQGPWISCFDVIKTPIKQKLIHALLYYKVLKKKRQEETRSNYFTFSSTMDIK